MIKHVNKCKVCCRVWLNSMDKCLLIFKSSTLQRDASPNMKTLWSDADAETWPPINYPTSPSATCFPLFRLHFLADQQLHQPHPARMRWWCDPWKPCEYTVYRTSQIMCRSFCLLLWCLTPNVTDAHASGTYMAASKSTSFKRPVRWPHCRCSTGILTVPSLCRI